MARERPDSTRSRPLTAAESELVEQNTRLAWWTAAKVHRRVTRHGPWQDADLLYEDLLDATLLGLTYAAKTYNPAIGRFSTYAVEVMQGECWRFLQRSQAKMPPGHLTMISLQDPLTGGSESGDAFSELVPDPNAINPEEETLRRALPSVLASVIDRLPQKDAEVIRRRYLRGENLDAVGAAIGRSRQRAHQIERRALGRLREYLAEQGYATAGDLI